jgi:flagella basal body P-ring formation protein FlgA
MIAILMFAAEVFRCQPVSGDRIRGADLAAAAPALSTLPADLVVGFAPEPGARRVFASPELMRIALGAGIREASGLEPVCFERAVAALEPSAVEAAMHRALEDSGANIEIVELSKFPAPAGEIVFPRTALNEPASGDSAVWNGYVSYASGHFPIWARVRVLVERKQVVALVPLRPGRAILASEVEVQEAAEFPKRTSPLDSLDRVVGRIPRRSIAAGAPILPTAIDEPNDVSPGETTVVEVRSGSATVTIEAEAASAGRRGDMVSFRNPVSGKVFRARVEDKGRASIDCQPLETAQ